jgi:hypothetical protein
MLAPARRRPCVSLSTSGPVPALMLASWPRRRAWPPPPACVLRAFRDRRLQTATAGWSAPDRCSISSVAEALRRMPMRRREFVSLLGTSAIWPVAVLALFDRMRRIGVLMGFTNDAEGQARITARRLRRMWQAGNWPLSWRPGVSLPHSQPRLRDRRSRLCSGSAATRSGPAWSSVSTGRAAI